MEEGHIQQKYKEILCDTGQKHVSGKFLDDIFTVTIATNKEQGVVNMADCKKSPSG